MSVLDRAICFVAFTICGVFMGIRFVHYVGIQDFINAAMCAVAVIGWFCMCVRAVMGFRNGD